MAAADQEADDGPESQRRSEVEQGLLIQWGEDPPCLVPLAEEHEYLPQLTDEVRFPRTVTAQSCVRERVDEDLMCVAQSVVLDCEAGEVELCTEQRL